MANRFGNQYRIAIGKETSYGSGFTQMSGDPAVGSVAWDDLLVHSGVINMTPVINTSPTTYKSGLTVTHPCEEIPTTSMGNVTVSGDATIAILEKYIGGVMIKPSSDYVFPANTASLPSFVLYQIWDDAPSATKYKVGAVKGAKLQQLVITGSQGGLVQFEATFETQTVKREVQLEYEQTFRLLQSELKANKAKLHTISALVAQCTTQGIITHEEVLNKIEEVLK